MSANAGVWVKYSVSKQPGAFHKTNTFLVPKPHDIYVTNYLKETNRIGRVFKNFNKNFTIQPMGVRTIALVPAAVSKFLNVEGSFTGHCFRRSAATILAENGATSVQMKTLMNWKGESTALNYIDHTKRSRVNTSGMISGNLISGSRGGGSGEQGASNGPNLSGAQFTSCVFNFGSHF